MKKFVLTITVGDVAAYTTCDLDPELLAMLVGSPIRFYQDYVLPAARIAIQEVSHKLDESDL